MTYEEKQKTRQLIKKIKLTKDTEEMLIAINPLFEIMNSNLQIK